MLPFKRLINLSKHARYNRDVPSFVHNHHPKTVKRFRFHLRVSGLTLLNNQHLLYVNGAMTLSI